MGIINLLKINEKMGALVFDEESTYFQRRRTHFDENLRELFEPDRASEEGICAVYGGTGYPPFHFEVFGKAKKALKTCRWDKPSLRKTAEIVREAVQQSVKRRIDDKLNLYFGFDSDCFNRGFFEKNNERFEVSQEKVKKKAMEIRTPSKELPGSKEIFNNKSVIAGYDPIDGFQAYHIDSSIHALSFLTGFESIGPGKYGACAEFARAFNKKFLSERREGFDKTEGLALLLRSIITAGNHYIDIGGYLGLMLIDENRITCFDPHRVKLASEIISAEIKGLVSQGRSLELLDYLLFQDGAQEQAEKDLFSSAEDPVILELCLRGYKIDPDRLRPEEESPAGLENRESGEQGRDS